MENKINIVDPNTWQQLNFATTEEEEEELDEFGNPIVAVDLFSQGRRNLDETVEEREYRQEAELAAKREETNRDRYTYNEAGQVVLDENTGQPLLEELSSFEKMANSFGNMVDQIQQAIPNASLGVNSLVRKVLGDEAIDNFLANENVPQFFKDFGTMTTEEADEALQQQQLQEAEMQETGSITEGLKNFDVGELAAGIVNGFTSIGSTAFTSALSGGTSLIPEMIGRSYVGYNEALAEKEGKSLNQYMEETGGGENTWTSIAIGVGSGLLERAGLKGAGKYLTNQMVSRGLGKTFTNVFLSGNKEGLTEYIQTGLEAVNVADAKGENKTEAFVDAVISQDGLESYLQGFVGGAAMRGGPKYVDKGKNLKFKKATAALRGQNETVLQNQALENIAELRKTLFTTTDPQVKKEIKEGIAIEEAKIIDITLRAQAKAEKLTDKELDEVSTIQDDIDAISNGITELDQKLADGVINTEQRNAAVRTYEEQFFSKQEELNVINNESSKRIIPSAFESRENTALNLVNLYDDLDRAIVNGDTELESEINSKIFKAEQVLKTSDEIIAEDSVILSEQAQELYDNRGIEALNSIVETQEGTIRKVAIDKLNSVPQNRRYDGDVEALASELRYGPEGVARLIETYNPETKVPIAAYIAEQLPRRVQRAAKKVLSQDNTIDFNATEAENLLVEDKNEFEVKIGSKLLTDQLKLPISIVDKAKKIIPAGLQKAVNELQDNKDLTIKKRQAIAEQAVASIYNSQLVKDIKAEFGKNTKTKEDFSNYLNKNYRALATAFIAQNAAQKGTGISKQWAMFPPTKSEFVDYYEGKDIALDKKNRSQPISDRKDALAQAVSRQIAEDVRAEYLQDNPAEARQINKAANKDVAEESKIVIASAIANAQETPKKARVFDFDDTLAKTNSNVLYALPDGTEGSLDATQFAEQFSGLQKEGATFDYSEFSQVKDGKKGPLADVAKKINDSEGERDLFVLTARPANADIAIQEFLKQTLDINIPLKNITGLGDGKPSAKADWIGRKVSQGYNDIFFADDVAANVKAVGEKLNELGVKNKVQQARENIVSAFEFEQFQKSLEKTKEDFAENSLDWKKLLENEGIEDFNLNNEERVQTFLKLLKSTGLTKLLPASFFRQFNGTTDPSSVIRGGKVFYQLKNGGEVEAVTKINNKGEEVFTYPPEYGKNGKGKFKNSLLRTRRGHVFFKSAPDADAWIAENGPFAAESELYKDLFTSTSYDKIVNGRREIKLENDFKNPEFKKQQENKLKALKQIFNIFEDFIAKDPKNNAAVVGGLLKSSSGWQGHFMRLASPVKFTSKGKMFDYSKNPKGKALFTEEHTLPASAVAKFLFRQAINGKVNDNFNLIEKNYFQGALLNVNDDKLAGNGPDGRRFSYKSKTPEGWMLTDSIWARYFNANVNFQNGGIDPNSIILSNGQTIAEFFGAGLDGITSNPDLINAQQKVITEKADPIETIFSSAREDMYNEPANNRLSQEEAIEALSDLLEANWNRDGKQNVRFITDPSVIQEELIRDGKTEKQAKDDTENNHGFLYGNSIFVNLKSKKGLETLLHEAGHLWNGIVRKSSPEVWNRLVNQAKESGLFAEYLEKVKQIPTYNKIVEDYENGINTYKLEDEVIARILEDL